MPPPAAGAMPGSSRAPRGPGPAHAGTTGFSWDSRGCWQASEAAPAPPAPSPSSRCGKWHSRAITAWRTAELQGRQMEKGGGAPCLLLSPLAQFLPLPQSPLAQPPCGSERGQPPRAGLRAHAAGCGRMSALARHQQRRLLHRRAQNSGRGAAGGRWRPPPPIPASPPGHRLPLCARTRASPCVTTTAKPRPHLPPRDPCGPPGSVLPPPKPRLETGAARDTGGQAPHQPARRRASPATGRIRPPAWP